MKLRRLCCGTRLNVHFRFLPSNCRTNMYVAIVLRAKLQPISPFSGLGKVSWVYDRRVYDNPPPTSSSTGVSGNCCFFFNLSNPLDHILVTSQFCKFAFTHVKKITNISLFFHVCAHACACLCVWLVFAITPNFYTSMFILWRHVLKWWQGTLASRAAVSRCCLR